MKKFGLIGYPISHSLSPALFKAGYDGRYPYELIETPDFEEAYQRFLNEYDGINVTAPFKEAAYAKADIISEECRLIEASNLLVKTPDGIAAYNSDYRGLLHWLKSLAIPSEQPLSPAARGAACLCTPHCHQTSTIKVLIVGLGGAGKAAAAAAWKAGLDVTLMNRNISKAEVMAARLGKRVTASPLTDFCNCFNEADIVIYNLPVRLPALEDLQNIPNKKTNRKFLLEANYKNPSFDEELLNTLRHNGMDIEYHGGRTWLLLQALTGYELFTGEKPDLSKMTGQI